MKVRLRTAGVARRPFLRNANQELSSEIDFHIHWLAF